VEVAGGLHRARLVERVAGLPLVDLALRDALAGAGDDPAPRVIALGAFHIGLDLVAATVRGTPPATARLSDTLDLFVTRSS
jgi:hypothetical protein